MTSLPLSRPARNQASAISDRCRRAEHVGLGVLREASAIIGLTIALVTMLWAATWLGAAPLPGLD